MEKRRIRLEMEDCPPFVTIDCAPPFPDLNLFFRAAAQAFIAPYQLAIDVGKLTEASAERIYAMAYAEGVIMSSPTEGFESFEPADWTQWLIEHPIHFRNLREICDYRRNWEDADDCGEKGYQDLRAATQ